MNRGKDPRDLMLRTSLHRMVGTFRAAGLSDQQMQAVILELVTDEAERAAAVVWGKYTAAAEMCGLYLNN